jgi:hypothetical protein
MILVRPVKILQKVLPLHVPQLLKLVVPELFRNVGSFVVFLKEMLPTETLEVLALLYLIECHL